MADYSSKPSLMSFFPEGESADELAGGDFLFHLYRGAELLQENDVHEAKVEIENALRLQPRDPKGQDLLALVYFRLGMYPRAIAIYEAIAAAFPEQPTPRINLALCYLKTGQPDRARQQLEEVVRMEPTRERAWGYLGLAFERTGDYDKARISFERAGHRSMARRMGELAGERAQPTMSPPRSNPEMQEVRDVAEAAFHELDTEDFKFSVARSYAGADHESGSWLTVEPGHNALQAPPKPRDLPIPSSRPPPAVHPPAVPPHAACRVEEFARLSTFVFPKDGRVSRRADGVVLVQPDEAFCVRLDLVRAMGGDASNLRTDVLMRRTRDAATDVPLGQSMRPITQVSGVGSLVLRAPRGWDLVVIELQAEAAFVREERLAGFDQALRYTNGRLAGGRGGSLPVVQLQGTGFAVFELPESYGCLEIRPERSGLVRCDQVLGWVGRLAPRPLSTSEVPSQIRGWLQFAGEGSVLVRTAADGELTL